MTIKTYLTRTILIALGLFLFPAFVVVTIDPFFLFHKPWFSQEMKFEENSRYQNAGLIRSVLADPDRHIDHILIGTSMSENFPVKEMDIKTGNVALKLTVAGGRPKELAMIARKAISTGRVHHVTWEIFQEYANPDPNVVHPQVPLPQFLYDDNSWNDIRYVFNNDVFRKSIKVLKGGYKNRSTLETLYTWETPEDFKNFSGPENLSKIKRRLAEPNALLLKAPTQAMEQSLFPNVDQNFLDVVKAHPDITFDVFFPPVSYYEHVNRGNERFWADMQMREYLLRMVQDLPNVTVYGFDLIDGISNNLNIYRDSQHYRPWVNRLMAQSMAHKKYVLSYRNWSTYQASLIRRIHQFVIKTKETSPVF